MFDKEFNKLVKEHPERFEYDFEVPATTNSTEGQVLLDADREKRNAELKKRLADRKSIVEKMESQSDRPPGSILQGELDLWVDNARIPRATIGINKK